MYVVVFETLNGLCKSEPMIWLSEPGMPIAFPIRTELEHCNYNVADEDNYEIKWIGKQIIFECYNCKRGIYYYKPVGERAY